MVYELDLSFVFKLPQISFASESCILIYQLHIAVRHNEFISVSVFVCLFLFFFHIHVRFHFKTPREFYACDWTTTFSEQQNSQTITDSFWHLQCLFVVGQTPVSGHLVRPHIFSAYLHENHSRKQPALVTDTFFAHRGCPLTKASTVVEFSSWLDWSSQFWKMVSGLS